MVRAAAILCVLLAGCSTYQPSSSHSSSNPRYRFGDCVRFDSSNHHHEKIGQILEVKDAQYYVQIEVLGGDNFIYADLIPISQLEQITVRATCPSRSPAPVTPPPAMPPSQEGPERPAKP